MQHMFLPTKTGCSENQKSLFCEKNHFLFSGQVQKMSLSHIAKNVPKTQFQPNLTFFVLDQKSKSDFFSQKNHFLFIGHVKKMPIFNKLEFLAHFWQYGSVTFFRLGQKTRSDYFHKKITFCLLLMSKKNANFHQSRVFGPFSAIWLSDIFWTWPENKK